MESMGKTRCVFSYPKATMLSTVEWHRTVIAGRDRNIDALGHG